MSLIHWWPLNGDTRDYGTNALDGTLIDSATVTAAGKLSKCLTAGNGSASGNGVSVPGNLLNELTTQATVACWIKVNGNHYHYNGTIFSSGNWNNQCWAFGLSQDNTQVDLFGTGYNRYVSCAVSTGVWHHLCCVNNNGTCKVYLDGVYKTSGTNAIPTVSDASNMCIGRETYAGGYFTFNGYINDMRVYDTCLSEAEVKDLAKCLTIHYPLNDGYIEATTNSYAYSGETPYWSQTFYDGATGNYGYNTNTNGQYEVVTAKNRFGIDKKVIKVSLRTARETRPYVHIDYLAGYISNNTYATVSLDMYSTCTNNVAPYSYYSGFYFSYWNAETRQWVGGDGTSITIPNLKVNAWNHIVYRIYRNGENTSGPGYLPIGSSSSTSDYWLFDNIQVEMKDHETPYVNGSRSGQLAYDTSGYSNNATPSSTLTTTTDTARYSRATEWADSASAITIGNLATLIPEGIFTFNVWFKKETGKWSSKSYETILGGPSGFELEGKPAGTNTNKIRLYSWGGSDGSKDFTYPLDQWNMLTMVRTASATTWYLNGAQVQTGSAGSIPSGNYFLGAWSNATGQNYLGKMSDARFYATALSAADILELYNTPIMVTKPGTLVTKGEIVE